jgi:hypothetical protein
MRRSLCGNQQHLKQEKRRRGEEEKRRKDTVSVSIIIR